MLKIIVPTTVFLELTFPEWSVVLGSFIPNTRQERERLY